MHARGGGDARVARMRECTRARGSGPALAGSHLPQQQHRRVRLGEAVVVLGRALERLKVEDGRAADEQLELLPPGPLTPHDAAWLEVVHGAQRARGL